MTTFDQIVIKCPHCGILMRDFEVMSYTVHGSATCFSDGMGEDMASMNGSKEISICDKCNKPFWRELSKIEGREFDWETTEGLPSAHDIYDLHFGLKENGDELRVKFYHDLVEQGFATDDWQEMHLRTRLWWAINDIIRNLATCSGARNLRQLSSIINHRRQSKKLFRSYATLFDQNLDRLIFLYIKGMDIDMLYLANMYREKADFKKALDILNKYEGRKGRQYSAINRRIRFKNRKVFKL